MKDVYKILAVDDEKEILESIEYVFSSSQIQVFTALNPGEADAVLQQFKIDLIVSDEIFPGYRGQAWINRLRQRYDHMRYIIFSGQLELVDICLSPNCSFIFKPDFHLLKLAIKESHQNWLESRISL